ncbi:hypothetical protein ACFXDF_46280, partial [Streptomyces sp. NPDC059426]|uniref:hypothetical protein n=1 Tax=Streptomyces sp. NPDC059426 TaxID=3346827 RepID=UPI0036863522
MQTDQRPGHAGSGEAVSVPLVILGLWDAVGQGVTVVVGKSRSGGIAYRQQGWAWYIQAHGVRQRVGEAGEFEIDEAGVGGSGSMEQDVVGFRILVKSVWCPLSEGSMWPVSVVVLRVLADE